MSAREQLLDAVDGLLSDRTWAKLSMGEVARRAGLSRQTLYNEFGSRTEFAEALIVREAERLLAGPERALAAHPDDPRAGVEEALAAFLDAAAHNRLVESMLAEADDGLLAVVTTRDAVLSAATDRLTAVVKETFPAVDAADARRLCEVVVRLGISHATLPTGTPAATASELTAVLGPHLDELMAPREHSHAA